MKKGKQTHAQVKARSQNAFDFVSDAFVFEIAFSLHFWSQNRSDTKQFEPQHGECVKKSEPQSSRAAPAASTASRAHGEGIGSSHRDRAIEGDATRAWTKLRAERKTENKKEVISLK